MVQTYVIILEEAKTAFEQGKTDVAEKKIAACINEIETESARTKTMRSHPFVQGVRFEACELLARIRAQQNRFDDSLKLMIDVLNKRIVVDGYEGKIDWTDPVQMSEVIRDWKSKALNSEVGVFFQQWQTDFNSRLRIVSRIWRENVAM